RDAEVGECRHGRTEEARIGAVHTAPYKRPDEQRSSSRASLYHSDRGGSSAQMERIAISSLRPSGTAGLGRLAEYQRLPSRGDRMVRLPGIWRWPLGSVVRTQSRA